MALLDLRLCPRLPSLRFVLPSGSEYLRAGECVLGYCCCYPRPETSTQVTIAALCTAFQAVSIFVPESVYWATVAVTPDLRLCPRLPTLRFVLPSGCEYLRAGECVLGYCCCYP